MLWTAQVKEEPVVSSWEPVELTALKRKLASLSCHFCNCITARRAVNAITNAPLNIDKSPKAVTFTANPNEKNIQVGQNVRSFDQYTQAREEDIFRDQNPDLQNKDMCPSCYVTMNLLRAGKLFRVLKDEESETKAEMCDKCTENPIESMDKTTSICSPYDNPELCQVVNYSDASLDQDVKRSPHVRFWDVKMNTDINAMMSPPCVDELIESIRPSPYSDMNFQ